MNNFWTTTLRPLAIAVMWSYIMLIVVAFIVSTLWSLGWIREPLFNYLPLALAMASFGKNLEKQKPTKKLLGRF